MVAPRQREVAPSASPVQAAKVAGAAEPLLPELDWTSLAFVAKAYRKILKLQPAEAGTKTWTFKSRAQHTSIVSPRACILRSQGQRGWIKCATDYYGCRKPVTSNGQECAKQNSPHRHLTLILIHHCHAFSHCKPVWMNTSHPLLWQINWLQILNWAWIVFIQVSTLCFILSFVLTLSWGVGGY